VDVLLGQPSSHCLLLLRAALTGACRPREPADPAHRRPTGCALRTRRGGLIFPGVAWLIRPSSLLLEHFGRATATENGPTLRGCLGGAQGTPRLDVNDLPRE